MYIDVLVIGDFCTSLSMDLFNPTWINCPQLEVVNPTTPLPKTDPENVRDLRSRTWWMVTRIVPGDTKGYV